MFRNIKDSSTISYKNPFDDFNANVLDPQMIMQYWYTPFNVGALKNFDEKKFYTQRMPIILQGSRGSGKTTILKYFSFPVQQERATQNRVSILKQIENDEGTGFYLRCDDSFLSMFKSVFGASQNDFWMACFEHYLELFFVKNILEMIERIDDADVSRKKDNIVVNLNLKEYSHEFQELNFNTLIDYVSSEIKYISAFRNEVLFTKAKFTPIHLWGFYDISGRLIEIISKVIPSLETINFLLLIDEFENLPPELQKLFNTMIKFCKPRITMRIGRRSENLVIKDTVNSVEYLREQHDYDLIILDKQKDINELKPYLKGIAERRLEAFDSINVSTNISDLFGDKEDLDHECSVIASNENLHMKYLLAANSTIRKNKELLESILNIIAYPENRIAEMLNALWVARSNEQDLIKVAQTTVQAMHAYFTNTENALVDKYRGDYKNKYRYALTVVLCASYRKDKSYYSFNTICFLSEGNARTFINLCKAIINDAMFYEKKEFQKTGRISNASQFRAIKEFSMNEFNSVCSIIQNGDAIKRFILNLGNIFSEYHKDRAVRYPETNQFVFDMNELHQASREIIRIAESWSIIRRREAAQRLSASVDKRGDIYTINRIFSPIFNITYRTRGGVNVELSSQEIELMLAGQYKKSKLTSNAKSMSKSHEDDIIQQQLTLFDEEWGE